MQVTNSKNHYNWLFFETTQNSSRLFGKKRSAALLGERDLLEVATSFIPPVPKTAKQIPNRSKGAIGAIAPFAAGAGLVLGQLLKDSACKKLYILNLCKNDDNLWQYVDKVFWALCKDFLLGNAMKATQGRGQKLTQAVDERFREVEHYLTAATLFLARSSIW